MTVYGVSLLSGGLDSTTVTAYARKRVERLTAVTFHYGQTHSKEVDCARRVAELLGVEQRLVDISFLGDVAWYSALTSPDRFPIPDDRPLEEAGASIPATYVPLRNTIFVSLAAALLESRVLHAIEVDGVRPQDVTAYVYMAPNAIDYSGYPDCRPEFYDQMKQTLRYGSKLWAQYEIPMEIETPVIQMTKAEIIAMALGMEAPIEHTWSCYRGDRLPCGACDSCRLRARGFERARVADPLLLRLGVE